MKKIPEIRFPEFSGEWIEKRLGEVGKIVTGTTPSTKIKSYYENGIYPWVTPTDINENKDIYKTQRRLTEEGIKKGRFIPKNSLLVTCIASIGKNAILRKDGSCNQQINAIIPSQDNNVDFLYYKLETMKNKLLAFAGQTATPILNKTEFSKIKIHIPPTLAEQKKIANFLSSVDEKIEIVDKKIKELKKYKKGLLQKFLNVKKGEPELRFEGFSGKWVEKRLGEVLKERKEYIKKTNNITHLTLSKEGIFPKTEQFNRDFLVIDKNKKYKVTYFNDICYNPANLKFGVICRNKYGKGIFSPIYITFETYNINPVFIENIITSDTFINKALKYQEGTVYERMAVKPEDLLKLKIHIPPTLSEQEKIAEFLSSIDEKIELNEKSLQALKKYKQGLLQKMFV